VSIGECGSTPIDHGEGEDVEKPPEGEDVVSGGGRYLFRGDDWYRGGNIGRAMGFEADEADIQSFADHILRKESYLSSRYTSFTTDTKVARKFTSAADNRCVIKVELTKLRELQSQGRLGIWDAELVFDSLRQCPKKIARQAADVRAAMRRNREILIEGQIPAEVIESVIP